MNEPDWATMGYTAHGYSGECECCGEVVELPFGEGERGLLSLREKDADFDQDELFAFVFYWTLLKLEQECDCARETEDLNMWSSYT